MMFPNVYEPSQRMSVNSKFQNDCMESLHKYPVIRTYVIRTYVMFNVDFRLGKYLLCIKDFKIRKPVVKLKSSQHLNNKGISCFFTNNSNSTS